MKFWMMKLRPAVERIGNSKTWKNQGEDRSQQGGKNCPIFVRKKMKKADNLEVN